MICPRITAARGDLRLVNVSAGFGGKSYMAYQSDTNQVVDKKGGQETAKVDKKRGPVTDSDRQICTQLAPIFELHGVVLPRGVL